MDGWRDKLDKATKEQVVAQVDKCCYCGHILFPPLYAVDKGICHKRCYSLECQRRHNGAVDPVG
jgi:hypothetical protein